jgi:hypothetical protein
MSRSLATNASGLPPHDLFAGYGPEVAGRGATGSRIARVVSRALKDARDGRDGDGRADHGDGTRPMTRAEIARQISALLGRPVSATILDKWASEASDDHRIPLDAFIALIAVTGARGLIGFVPQQFGHSAIADAHADLVELTFIRARRAELEAQERALEDRVRRAVR